MNNVKDPRKAQELAVQMLPLADAWLTLSPRAVPTMTLRLY